MKNLKATLILTLISISTFSFAGITPLNEEYSDSQFKNSELSDLINSKMSYNLELKESAGLTITLMSENGEYLEYLTKSTNELKSLDVIIDKRDLPVGDYILISESDGVFDTQYFKVK